VVDVERADEQQQVWFPDQIAGQLNVTYGRVQTGYHRGLRQPEGNLAILL
jgi:hypothetical protein